MNVVELSMFAKYAQILKNSVASKETTGERMFLMTDQTAVEGTVELGGGAGGGRRIGL